MSDMLSVLALVPYPLGTTPSQRFRLEQWAPLLERDHAIRVEWAPFADHRLASLLTRPGHLAAKSGRMVLAGLGRIPVLARARRHDLVLVHRAALLVGPAWLERLLAWSGRPFVFDFDDAIWLRHTSGANPLFDRLKFPGKTAALCRLASLVVAGSEHLAAYARGHNERVAVVPTSIDISAYVVRPRPPRARVVVGWTGSATSLTHLEAFAGVLRTIVARRPVEVRVLSTREPVLPGVPVVFRHWTPENEIEEIGAFDIGIKPLPDDEWAWGKCPMKELQYMALGVPAVCSAVGGTREAVRNGENGFQVRSLDEWIARLTQLVDDPALRARLGAEGRRTVEERYSAPASAAVLARALRTVVGGR